MRPGTRRRLCLAAATALLSAWPASAGASPLDTASDRVALSAYHTYIGALLSGIPASRQHADAFVASISASCPSVLEAVGRLPAGSINEDALNLFGQEIGFDTVLAMGAPGGAPLATLSRALSRLRWSGSQTAANIARLLKAKRALVMLAPSDLCLDARTLASSNAQVTPPGTLQFLATVRRDIHAADIGASAFEHILSRFQAPSERQMIETTNRLITRLELAYSTLGVTETLKLFPALGLVEATS